MSSGWNRNPVGEKPKAKPKSKNSIWLVVGLIVVAAAVAVLCASLFSGGEKEIDRQKSKRDSKIKEVTPARAKQVVVEEPAKEPEPVDPNLRIHVATNPITGTIKVVTNRLDKLPKNRNTLAPVPGGIQPRRKLYKTFAENYVAALIRVQPGAILPAVALPANFDDEFKARIADPIGIEPEDTDEDIEVRRQVLEFKKEAAKLIGEGMTPSEIVLNERKAMNRLTDMRNNLNREIGMMRRNGSSEEDIKVAVEAANQILEKNGAPTITYKTRPPEAIKKGINQ